MDYYICKSVDDIVADECTEFVLDIYWMVKSFKAEYGALLLDTAAIAAALSKI